MNEYTRTYSLRKRKPQEYGVRLTLGQKESVTRVNTTEISSLE